MEEWKLEVKGLSYTNRRFSLESVDFKIKPGTATGILGKNGSGKSTLLNLIHGDLKTSSGEVLVDGKNIDSYSTYELSRKISFLFQEMYEPFSFTVRDIMNVSGYSREESVSSYMNTLAELGIAGLADIQFTNLSGGERRLVTIAASVYQDSEIMLLDEPTTFLDIDNQLTVQRLLESLKERGKTIVMVMHDVNAIHSLCDDVLMLRSGKVVSSGPVDQVLNEENLKNTFDVPFSEISLDTEKLFVSRNRILR